MMTTPTELAAEMADMGRPVEPWRWELVAQVQETARAVRRCSDALQAWARNKTPETYAAFQAVIAEEQALLAARREELAAITERIA